MSNVNWVKARAECTTTGFMRKLRKQALEDACEASKHHKPGKVFSISGDGNPDFRVERKLKDCKDIDAFVRFSVDDEASISAVFHYRNGDHRRTFSERKLETVKLEWSYEDNTCKLTIAEESVSEVEFRQRTLGNCSSTNCLSLARPIATECTPARRRRHSGPECCCNFGAYVVA